MTLEYYRNFIAIAECGSILSAAQKLMVAQPALSNQLKAMEREYGTLLAVRGPRGIRLTREGEILYSRAKAILALDDLTRNDIRCSSEGISGTLSVALPPTNARGFLSDLFSVYCGTYPEIRLQLHELQSEDVARYVEEGRAEIGFLRAPIRDPDRFRFLRLPDDEITAFLPPSHPLAEKKALTAEDLKGLRFTMSRGCEIPVREFCSSLAFRPDPVCVSTSRTVALRMASILSCCALVPIDDGTADPEFVVRHFSPGAPVLPRSGIVRRDGALTRPAEHFLELLRLSGER